MGDIERKQLHLLMITGHKETQTFLAKHLPNIQEVKSWISNTHIMK